MNALLILSILDDMLVAAPFVVVVAIIATVIEKNGCSKVFVWICAFIGLFCLAIITDSSAIFWIVVGILAVFMGIYSFHDNKYKEEQEAKKENDFSITISGEKMQLAYYDETADNDNSKEKLIDDYDHYCPSCGSLMLYKYENDDGNIICHCNDCGGDFKENELIVMSKCRCPNCEYRDIRVYKNSHSKYIFRCYPCGEIYNVDDMKKMMS